MNGEFSVLFAWKTVLPFIKSIWCAIQSIVRSMWRNWIASFAHSTQHTAHKNPHDGIVHLLVFRKSFIILLSCDYKCAFRNCVCATSTLTRCNRTQMPSDSYVSFELYVINLFASKCRSSTTMNEIIPQMTGISRKRFRIQSQSARNPMRKLNISFSSFCSLRSINGGDWCDREYVNWFHSRCRYRFNSG